MPDLNAPSAPTSIRLKPTTKHFLDCQAGALNTSVQSLISIILDGVAETTLDKTSGTLRSIRERFFYLFQTHELDSLGIISVMKSHGFTLSSLENSAQFLDLIDQKSRQYLVETFFVRPEWISGESDSFIKLDSNVRWYKRVYGAGEKLLGYAKQGLKPHVLFIRRKQADFAKAKADNDSGNLDREPIGVVVRLSRKTDDGVSFTVYEVWEFERWNYWRCREQIKLLITFCDQSHGLISYSGYELAHEDIKALVSGSAMPAEVMGRIYHDTWFPDDYASLRSKVTKEIDEWKEIQATYEKGHFERLINETLSNV